MKVVGLEEHVATEDIFAAWRKHDPTMFDEPLMQWTVSGELGSALCDVGESRLRDMDVAGVDTAVLSVTTPGLQNLPAREAVALQGPTNDMIADAVRQHPDRFQGFAALATPSPGDAARELERAVVDLGFNGAMLHTLSGGEFLDESRYWEIFEVAEHHRVPLYLHPSVPAPAVADAYYRGFGTLGTGALGWHYQTGVGIMRMILSGVFDRFPDLQLIAGHWGEVVLFFLDRAALLDKNSKLELPVAEYFRRNIYVTPGGVASQRYMGWAKEVVGADRIMHATDYPFVKAGA
ncbi:MAG: amidohydrolase family protein, partial [Actinomycetota bacterium]|nr:amidohydrolase family protein [Actinomycetota bacterium]